jgi:hypothetical protein
MVEITSWDKITELKKRMPDIKYDLAKINRFLSNPFENKSLTVDQRKTMWIKVTGKKRELEKELLELNNLLKRLMNENKVKTRRKKK